MWNAVSSVSSIFALLAFITAAVVEVMRRRLASRDRQISLAPAEDRLVLAQTLNDSFLVLGRPIDTAKLTKDQQFQLLMTQTKDRMRRFYVIAVSSAAIALAGGGALAVAKTVHPSLPPGSQRERDIATNVLDACYRGDFKGVYDNFAILKSQMTFTAAAAEIHREGAQFTTRPAYRRIEREQLLSGYWVVTFLAEFDAISTFREVVSFSRVGSSWEIFRVDIWPSSWQQTSTSRFLPGSPSEITRALSGLGGQNATDIIRAQFKGFYTPAPGWNLMVGHPEKKSAKETCDVMTHDRNSGTLVLLRNVMGGCALKAGESIAVLGILSTATDNQIELDAIRFFA